MVFDLRLVGDGLEGLRREFPEDDAAHGGMTDHDEEDLAELLPGEPVEGEVVDVFEHRGRLALDLVRVQNVPDLFEPRDLVQQLDDRLEVLVGASERVGEAGPLDFRQFLEPVVADLDHDLQDVEHEPEGVSVFRDQPQAASLHARSLDFLFEGGQVDRRLPGSAHQDEEAFGQFAVHLQPFLPVLVVVPRGFALEGVDGEVRFEDPLPLLFRVPHVALGQAQVEVMKVADFFQGEVFRLAFVQQALEVRFEKGEAVQIVVQVRDVHVDAAFGGKRLVLPLCFEGMGEEQEEFQVFLGLEADAAGDVFLGPGGVGQDVDLPGRLQEPVYLSRQVDGVVEQVLAAHGPLGRLGDLLLEEVLEGVLREDDHVERGAPGAEFFDGVEKIDPVAGEARRQLMDDEVVAGREKSYVEPFDAGVEDVLYDQLFDFIGLRFDFLQGVGDQVDGNEEVRLAGASVPDEQAEFLVDEVQFPGIGAHFRDVVEVEAFEEVRVRPAEDRLLDESEPVGVAAEPARKEAGMVFGRESAHGNVLGVDPVPGVVFRLDQAEKGFLGIELFRLPRNLLIVHISVPKSLSGSYTSRVASEKPSGTLSCQGGNVRRRKTSPGLSIGYMKNPSRVTGKEDQP